MYIGEDWVTSGVQSVDTQNFLDSVIIRNSTVVRKIRIPAYNIYENYWRNDPEMQRNYQTASFLLPIGSIFVLAVVVLLMALFKRCPYMVAATVTAILGIIILFVILLSLHHAPIYV